MARPSKSLHHNIQEGESIPLHREHRSKKNRKKIKVDILEKFDRSSRRKWKNYAMMGEFFDQDE